MSFRLRRGGCLGGPCFEAAGVQSEGVGGKGNNGRASGGLGASVRREESWEMQRWSNCDPQRQYILITGYSSTGSIPNHNDLMVLCEHRKLEERRQQHIPTNRGTARVGPL